MLGLHKLIQSLLGLLVVFAGLNQLQPCPNLPLKNLFDGAKEKLAG